MDSCSCVFFLYVYFVAWQNDTKGKHPKSVGGDKVIDGLTSLISFSKGAVMQILKFLEFLWWLNDVCDPIVVILKIVVLSLSSFSLIKRYSPD